MNKTTWIRTLVTAVITAVLTVVCFEAHECGAAIVAERDAERETAEKIAKWQEDAERRAYLVGEARLSGFLDDLDPQDASIWHALLPYAELDRDCNVLPECEQGPTHTKRPIMVVTRSKHGDAQFIAVLGVNVWDPRGHDYTPQGTLYYYVDDRAGTWWRIRPGSVHSEVRYSSSDEWLAEPTSDWVLNEARTAFINESRRRLVESGAQGP